MAAKFLMSRLDYGVSNLLKKLGYQEVSNNQSPDFIVFGGGPDVSPYLYNQEKAKGTHSDVAIDYEDFCTVIASKLKQIPMLGICRGLQLLHVANGGTLIQHMNGHAGVIHKLLCNDEEEIEGWEGLEVNSHHHQCIPVHEVDYADELYVSLEGSTEVIVAPSCGFLGVQYHPEYLNCPETGLDFFAELMKHKFQGML
jgi:putative glutamine amidotransferase